MFRGIRLFSGKRSRIISCNRRRFELRVRYLLSNLTEFSTRDRVTFTYFYEQVKNEYLRTNEEVDLELAITLCCLEIRRFVDNFELSQLEIRFHFFFGIL